MDKFVLGFSDFINEELNFTHCNDMCKLEDRWFYYNQEDDIIYGCDDKPVDDNLFAFNPKSCSIILGGEEKNYDVSNPICLITYDYDKSVDIFTEGKALEFLKSKGYAGDRIDVNSQANRASIGDFFENIEDKLKCILIYGDTLIASTFDVIEEN